MFKLLRLTTVITTFIATPMVAETSCLMASSGARCVVAGPPAPPRITGISQLKDLYKPGPALRIGTKLQPGEFNIMLMAQYYGLPPVKDGWVYMEVDKNIYRVDFRTRRILEVVTDQTAANW